MHKLNEIEITTRVFPDRIEQSIPNPGNRSQVGLQVMQLREEGVKKALKQLGYLTPEEAKDLAAKYAHAKANLAATKEALRPFSNADWCKAVVQQIDRPFDSESERLKP